LHEEDSAWKEILEGCFEEFLEFFFPEVGATIDWSHRPEWLDKEFQALFPSGGDEDRRRIVDKLAKVRLLSGEEEWILVHVEVQGESEAEFNDRMFRYNVLTRFRYGKEVVSLGVLTDEARRFRPGIYLRRMPGQVLLFRFPTVKLLDYEGRREELKASRNPFALVVTGHLEARGAKSAEQRFEVRFRLARQLYKSGMVRENIRRLYRFLEWILKLPEAVELELQQKIQTEIEGKTAMPYLATFERIAMEKGREEGRTEGREEGREEGVQQGLLEALRLVIRSRFGVPGETLIARLEAVRDVERLRSLAEAVGRAECIEDLRSLLEST